jgi:hypothetical protein
MNTAFLSLGVGRGGRGGAEYEGLRAPYLVRFCDFAYESPYDSRYDFLPKAFPDFIFDQFLLKCVNRPLYRCLLKNWIPYMAFRQIGHGIVWGIVRGFVHV